MMSKKKFALLAVVLASMLVGGVFAGMRLSNILTASWTVVETQDNLELSWAGDAPTGDIEVGKYYDTSIRLRNTGAATYNVIVKFQLWASGLTEITANSIVIQYWDGDSWEPVGIYTWNDAGYVKGYFGPSGGFPCGPGYDATTPLRYMFDADAPRTGYGIQIWVEEV